MTQQGHATCRGTRSTSTTLYGCVMLCHVVSLKAFNRLSTYFNFLIGSGATFCIVEHDLLLVWSLAWPDGTSNGTSGTGIRAGSESDLRIHEHPASEQDRCRPHGVGYPPAGHVQLGRIGDQVTSVS